MDALPYGILRQKSPNYREKVWSELSDLYEGGYALTSRPEAYLPRMVNEPEARYRERLRSAGYLGYLGQIVDYFTAALFTQELAVKPTSGASNEGPASGTPDSALYDTFAADADLRGNPLGTLLRDVFSEAILKKRALVAVDFPRATEPPASRADETALGSGRPYALRVPLEQLIDWEEDDHGGFSWAILNRRTVRRACPASTRRTVQEEFRIWQRDEAGRVTWSLYRVEYDDEKAPKDEDLIECVDTGLTSFQRIPLLVLEVPDGLWVGNKVGTLAKEHYQRRTSLVAAENRSLVAIPVAKLGPEMSAPGGALPSEAQQNPSRGFDPVTRFQAAGFMTIGKDDSIEFVEPQGSAYALVDSQLKELKDEMFRVVHQMAASVSNTTYSLGRSGLSKVMDRAAEAIVLGAYGALVRAFAKRLYETISEARGEGVTWATYGLDEYEAEDRETLLNEAVQVDAVQIPSKTFKQAYKTQLAFQLLAQAPPETLEQIRQEIADASEPTPQRADPPTRH